MLYSVCFIMFPLIAAAVTGIIGLGFKETQILRGSCVKSLSCAEPLMRKVCSVYEPPCENRLKIQIVLQQLVKSCFKHQ